MAPMELGQMHQSQNQPNMKILIADDDSTMRMLLLTGLTRLGYQVEVARNGAEAWDLLQQPGAAEIAIFDWMMPGITGVELCRKLRERKDVPYLYIILLTGMVTLNDLVAGMEAGADDYMTKPFKAAELNARLRAGRRILDLQRELLTAQAQLRVLANHDSLTGLWNRRVIIERLEQEIARAVREKSSLGVIMLDIDHFKRVNDDWGHAQGDAVLRWVAKVLHEAVRPYDCVGRYGGEEFLIVVTNCDMAETVKVAERVRRTLAATPTEMSDGTITVTASLGVSATRAGAALAGNFLIAAADRALYRAKDGGRNRVEWELCESAKGMELR